MLYQELSFLALLVSSVAYWNWSIFSWDFALMQAFDLLVSWALAGLVLAKVVTSPEAKKAQTV